MYDMGDWPTIENENVLYIANSSFGSTIQGILDELSIWNKALSLTQIQKMIYDTLSSEYYATADSGLVAYYRFDEYEDLGEGNAGTDDFRDFSFYGNHADSEGNPSLVPSGIFVGLEANHLSNDIIIYPNPASSFICLQSSVLNKQPAVVEIYDLNGRKLLEKLLPVGSETTEIDVSSLSKGLYFVRLQFKNQTITRKLIIQH
jgi:hypothetical protein